MPTATSRIQLWGRTYPISRHGVRDHRTHTSTKHGAEGHKGNKACEEDDEHREDSERSESAQTRRERIIEWRCHSRFYRYPRILFWQFRRPACHAETLPVTSQRGRPGGEI